MKTKKKAVLQLCHNYKSPFFDVAQQYAQLFIDSPYQLITVYLTGKKDSQILKQSLSEQTYFLEYQSKDLRGLKLKQIKQLKKIQVQYQFEFAIAHRYKAIYICCFLKNLKVFGVHHAFGGYNRLMRRLFVSYQTQNLMLLGVSNAIRDDIRKALPKFPQQQIQTLYNRIDIQNLTQRDKKTAREQLKLPYDAFIFANVGRLHPDKDQKTLITAFASFSAQNPQAILVILGQGRLECTLKQQVKQLNIEHKIFFLGLIPNAIDYFKAFDCFVLSSDNEPFGMVLLEAISAQIPIIATAAGGAQEIMTQKKWLFNVGDSPHLSQLLNKIIKLNQQDKHQIIQQNQQYLEQNFSHQAVKPVFWKLQQWFCS